MLFTRKSPKLVWTENKNWINSKPLTWESLRGHVVLLDFWTYSCINCVRTLPALKEMWSKYHDKKLIIIGIHTPEFEFEKDLTNVKKAARKHNLEYPILNDPDRTNWENYGNSYWPRVALIDAQGNLVLDHVGESGYDEIEAEIIKQLKKTNTLAATTLITEEKRYYPVSISKETYAGSKRNEGLGSAQVCSKKGCEEYYDSGKKYHQDIIYLQGEWKQEPEFLEFKGDAGHIALNYAARETNVVLDGKGAATILLNDKPLTEANAGKDVVVKGGKSLVFIDGPEMYNLIKSKEFQTSLLKIIPFKGLKVYAYTFG